MQEKLNTAYVGISYVWRNLPFRAQAAFVLIPPLWLAAVMVSP